MFPSEKDQVKALLISVPAFGVLISGLVSQAHHEGPGLSTWFGISIVIFIVLLLLAIAQGV